MLLLLYTLVLFVYFFYIYMFLIFGNKQEFKVKNEYEKKFSVVVPVYNENPKYLKYCINSILIAEGTKQIIIVDDGSTNKDTIEALDSFKGMITILRQKKNRGKRAAHALAIKYVLNDLVVFIDSDTIVEKNSLVELIKPFQDKQVGAVSGNIKLINKKQNFLTKCIDTMYWSSFNIHRQSSSNIGYMKVIPGALSAYRYSYLKKLMPEYLSQKFLGSKCDISDDTFLTIRIQTRFKKKVLFRKNAVAYTYGPATIPLFFKTLVRWNKGMFRENIALLKEDCKGARLMAADRIFTGIWLLIAAITQIAFILSLIFNFSIYYLISSTLWLAFSTTIFSLYFLFYNKKDFGYRLAFAYLYEWIFIFTVIPALLTLKKQSTWGSR